MIIGKNEGELGLMLERLIPNASRGQITRLVELLALVAREQVDIAHAQRVLARDHLKEGASTSTKGDAYAFTGKFPVALRDGRSPLPPPAPAAVGENQPTVIVHALVFREPVTVCGRATEASNTSVYDHQFTLADSIGPGDRSYPNLCDSCWYPPGADGYRTRKKP